VMHPTFANRLKNPPTRPFRPIFAAMPDKTAPSRPQHAFNVLLKRLYPVVDSVC